MFSSENQTIEVFKHKNLHKMHLSIHNLKAERIALYQNQIVDYTFFRWTFFKLHPLNYQFVYFFLSDDAVLLWVK